jgi:hypothetical protein
MSGKTYLRQQLAGTDDAEVAEEIDFSLPSFSALPRRLCQSDNLGVPPELVDLVLLGREM